MKISTVWKLSKSHTAENIAHIIWEIFACESESVYGLLVLGDSLYIKVVDFRYLIQLNNNHCRHLANQYEWMTKCSSRFVSVNHFPYLPIVTNPENNPCNQTVMRISTEIWTFVHWPIVNLPWKFHANPFGSFWVKLLTDKQTHKQRRKHYFLGGGNKASWKQQLTSNTNHYIDLQNRKLDPCCRALDPSFVGLRLEVVAWASALAIRRNVDPICWIHRQTIIKHVYLQNRNCSNNKLSHYNQTARQRQCSSAAYQRRTKGSIMIDWVGFNVPLNTL